MNDLLGQLAGVNQSVLLVGHLTDRIQKKMTGDLPDNVHLMPRPFAIPSTYQLSLGGEAAQPTTDSSDFVPQYLRITEAEANWQKLHPGETKGSYVREV